MNKLKGKTVLITAAGQGIGKAIVDLFVAEGASVIATDINPEALEQLTGCKTAVLDVTNAMAISQLAAEIPQLDILVNCAGYVHEGDLLSCQLSNWDLSFDINVKSMFLITQKFLPAMLIQGGSIINMSSLASSVKGVINRCAYGASKAAVIGLSKSIAVDYMDKGIRCNVICPATVQSPSLEQRLKNTGDYESALKAFEERQPMGRLGKPEEIAELALYLAGDNATFTTGQCHIIDGGWLA